jgi:hypothetical protein
MRRRDFIKATIGAVTAWPIATTAQQVGIRTLGILLPDAGNDEGYKSDLRVLLLELDKLGWKDGRNVKFEIRWGAPAGLAEARCSLRCRPFCRPAKFSVPRPGMV